MKVIITIETEKAESVKVYLREILNQIAKNEYFSITSYEMKVIKNEV